ncbi:MAG: beta-ketoacyl synthase N-terminal-like domain-containing protein [Desulfuromonas sp.]|nr:beta-ketoacyl synthase N-terminal-like domain-containing protein [Desulfuromonas sp.]
MLSADICGFGWVSVDGLGAGLSATNSCPFGEFRRGELPPVQRKDVLSRPDRSFGRMDQFSRLGLAGIALALRDAGLETWQDKRNIGVLAATVTGCMYTDVDYFKTVLEGQGLFASPQLFAYTLPNTFLGEAALRFGLTGNCQVLNSGINGDESHALAVVRTAMESIAWGENEKVIVGYCDLGDQGALHAPGALFMVLQPSTVAQADSVAALKLAVDEQGRLRSNDRTICSLQDLIKHLACTSSSA